MKHAQIKEKLHWYIDRADEKKLAAIYTIIEDDINKDIRWNDKKFVSEIERRINELENGEVKGVAWNKVKTKAEQKLKTIKK